MELCVFLTAAVIIDDLVTIGVIAVFYTEAINPWYLVASVVVTVLLVAMSRWGIYRPLPCAVLGIIRWICLHDAGLHATLAGVILALVTPVLPPANLRTLMAQAEAILQTEAKLLGEASLMRHGPSEPALWPQSTRGSNRPRTNCCARCSPGRVTLCCQSSHWRMQA